jgi:hypothetical protein
VPRDSAPAAVVELALRAAALIGNGLYGVDLKETPAGPGGHRDQRQPQPGCRATTTWPTGSSSTRTSSTSSSSESRRPPRRRGRAPAAFAASRRGVRNASAPALPPVLDGGDRTRVPRRGCRAQRRLARGRRAPLHRRPPDSDVIAGQRRLLERDRRSRLRDQDGGAGQRSLRDAETMLAEGVRDLQLHPRGASSERAFCPRGCTPGSIPAPPGSGRARTRASTRRTRVSSTSRRTAG